MQELVDAILRLGSESLATEDAACEALTRIRFPNGIRCHCGAACTRVQARVTCTRKPTRKRKPHRFTILVGTPFGSKLHPRIRALFLAIRAFAVSPRSVSARELARDVSMPNATLWRHLQTLRALMPPAAAHPTSAAATVQVCGRHKKEERAWVRVGARTAIARAYHPPAEGGNSERMVGESVRTLLNGTFRGVSARWLSAYLDEARARWRLRAHTATVLVERLLGSSVSLTFDDVRGYFSV